MFGGAPDPITNGTMNYQVIARRYRPRRFEEVVGQESVAATLRAGILQERIAHAYLFTGPRGVGKTSMARIFAKALNCPKAADREGPEEEWAQPCDDCSACEAIHLGGDIDVIEMDGASHRGIEDVRGLVESINRPATRSPYKVFIIDEVHMLTREAFNALLKTLEEPPAHVKFVFATTEAHRIPETVLSRCQRFDFHPIGNDAIVRRLGQILELEKREAEDGVLERVARYGKGGLRDAQTLLDQLMTFCDGVLNAVDLERVTGRVADDVVKEVAALSIAGNAAGVLEQVRECFKLGADPAMLLEQVVDEYRQRLYDHVAGDRNDAPAQDSGGSAGGPAGGSGSGSDAGALDRLMAASQILLETSSKLRHSSYPELSVELALLKVSRLEDVAALEDVIRLLRGLEGSAPPGSPAAPAGPPVGGRGGAVPSAQSPRVGRPPSARPSPPREEPGAPRAQDSSSALGDAAPGRGPNGGAERVPSGTSTAVLESPADPNVAGVTTLADSTAPAVEATSVETRTGPSNSGISSSGISSFGAVDSATGSFAAADFARLQSLWEQFRIELEAKHPDVAPFFKDIAPERDPAREDTILLRFTDEFCCRQMKGARRLEVFEALLCEVTGSSWRTRMDYDPNATKAPRAAASPVGPPVSSGAVEANDPGTVAPGSVAADAAGSNARGDESPPPAPGLPADEVASAQGQSNPPANSSDVSPASAAVGSPPPARLPPDGDGPAVENAVTDVEAHPLVKKSLDLFNGRLL